jgi:mannitol/fructose-specific phosphotransferase system IIA component (Ntr-type)
MTLEDFLGPEPNVVDLQAQNRWEAIDELVDHLVATGGVNRLVREDLHFLAADRSYTPSRIVRPLHGVSP